MCGSPSTYARLMTLHHTWKPLIDIKNFNSNFGVGLHYSPLIISSKSFLMYEKRRVDINELPADWPIILTSIRRYVLIIKHLSATQWWKDGVKLLLAWNLSLPLIDPLCCCAPFTACGSPAHPLMSSSCLLQLVINDCGPAEPGRKYLKTTCVLMQISAVAARSVWVYRFSRILWVWPALRWWSSSFACCVSVVTCKEKSSQTMICLWWHWRAILVAHKSFFQPQTGPKNKNLWKCYPTILCNTV